MRSAYAARRPVVNAYLVRERDRRRWRELAFVVLAILPAALGVLVNIWVQLEVLRSGYRIHALERQLDQQVQQERELRLEASYLANPERIERRAIAELGMQRPSIDQMIFSEELE